MKKQITINQAELSELAEWYGSNTNVRAEIVEAMSNTVMSANDDTPVSQLGETVFVIYQMYRLFKE